MEIKYQEMYSSFVEVITQSSGNQEGSIILRDMQAKLKKKLIAESYFTYFNHPRNI